MAAITLFKNPLAPHEKEGELLPDGVTAIDWLQKNYPNGFGMPCKFIVNGEEKPLDDLDMPLKKDDVAIIMVMPGGFLAGLPFLAKLVIGLVIAAAAMFAQMLFAPKPQKQKNVDPLDIPVIESGQNGAKLGEPVPVVYGSVWMTPDYVSSPHSFIVSSQAGWNEWMSGVQYLDLLLCVGQGDVYVDQIKMGDTPASALASGVVTWRTFTPAQHQKRMGVIQAAMGGNFYENVVVSQEVGNQQLEKAGDASGWFITSNVGIKGRTFSLDFSFPNGIYIIDGGSSKDMKSSSVSIDVYWREVDDNNNLFGPEYTQRVVCSSYVAGGDSGKWKPEMASLLQRTFYFNTTHSSRWAVRVVRLTPEQKASKGNTDGVWSGLKLIVDATVGEVYGDVTLLAVRIKASRGVNTDKSTIISCHAIRNLNLPQAFGLTDSAVDAFIDVYTNSTYGAGRPIQEIDTVKLQQLRSAWQGYTFNHVFTQYMTVWEALSIITTPFAAEPITSGQMISIAQDGVKPVRSMLFTDANIVDGSMKINYSFDTDDAADGIEIEWLDARDWRSSFVRYPETSVRPEKFTLPGVTAEAHARQYARLVWQRLRLQRKRISFDTELEGLLLQLGDRIAVSHELPRWGDSGLVLAVNKNEVTMDHDMDWSGGLKYIIFRKADGSLSDTHQIRQGAQPHKGILANTLSFETHFDDDYEYTAFTFGEATTIVKDFVVASAKHSGDNKVTVEAVNYDTTIFDYTMTYLGGAQ